jgi:uncharacterized protein YpuA (DUF1002 family)
MAKKITKDDNQKIGADELKKLLDSALERAAKAKEHNGEVSQIVRDALDTYGLDRAGFAMVRRIHKMAGDQQQAALRDFLKCAITMGWLSQRDAFDDVGELLATALGLAKPKLRAVS